MKKRRRCILTGALLALLLAGMGLQTAFADDGIQLPFIPGGDTHSYGQWVVQTAATCTETGVESSSCLTCGKERTQTVPALGHDPVTDAAVEPTCTATGLTQGSHCDRCGEVLEAQQTVPMTEHAYGEWTVITEPAFSLMGQRRKTCSGCGNTVEEILPPLTGKVEAWSIALGDMLRVDLRLNISSSIESTAAVEITVGETILKYPAAELEKTEEGLYAVSVELSAAQMTVPVSVRVVNGLDAAEEFVCTVRAYAHTVLADESLSLYHEVVRQLLHYGAAAQTYFAYCEELIANDGVADTATEEIPEVAPKEMAITGRADGIRFYAASLLYRYRVAVRFYFKCDGNIGDYSFAAGETAYIPVQKGDCYYVEVPGITPDCLDEQVGLSVSDGNGSTLTVSYSPMNYIVRMNEKGSDSLKVLLKALYNYHLAASQL